MRRWGLFLLVLVLVAGGVLGWGLLNVNRYLNQNRPWIEKQAEAAIGREVSFGAIGVSLWDGFGATLSDLSVADDPAFSDEPFLEAAGVRVEVSILPALLGRIEVREVVLETPVVRLIRTRAGMNTDSIAAVASSDPSRDSADARGPSAEGASLQSAAVVVALVSIEDGALDFTDRTSAPVETQVVRDIDLRVTGLGTDAPASLDLALALLGSDRQNVVLSGDVGPLPLAATESPEPIDLDLELVVGPANLKLSGELRMGPPFVVDLRIDSNEASIGGFRPFLPQLADYEVSGTAAVHLVLRGAVGGSRLPELTGDIGLSNVDVGLPESSGQIQGLSAKIEFLGEATRCKGELRIERGQVQNAEFAAFLLRAGLAGEVASFENIEMSLFEGTYAAKGRYDFRDPKQARLDLRQNFRDLDVGQILESQAPEAAGRMTGKLSGSLALEGSGGNGEAIRRTLRGKGKVAVSDGVLVGINLPEAILQSLTGVKGLTQILPEEIRTKYAEVFSQDDTPFETLSASVVIAEEKASTDDAVVAARDYALRGKGSVDFDGLLDFVVRFVASEGLTADARKSVREVRYITNEGGRLEVPVRIVGTIPDVKVQPDANFIARALTTGALDKGLELLRNQGGDGSSSASGAEADDGKTGRPEEVGAELIERGLRGLFGD